MQIFGEISRRREVEDNVDDIRLRLDAMGHDGSDGRIFLRWGQSLQ